MWCALFVVFSSMMFCSSANICYSNEVERGFPKNNQSQLKSGDGRPARLLLHVFVRLRLIYLGLSTKFASCIFVVGLVWRILNGD